MIIRSLVVGPLQANCFIIGDEKSRKAIVIDPGDEPDIITKVVDKERLTVEYIFCTHAHFDHVGAVPDLKKISHAKIVLHRDELEIYSAAKDMAAVWGYDLDPLPTPDLLVTDGEEIKIGSLTFTVLHTPGHSPGGMCLFGQGVVITGDTLFAGAVGRTDFHGGDMKKLKQSFDRLMSLPPDTKVLTGHGPDSTIARERSENFFPKLFT
ncbi:MAG TPA: MBL fold metallo-hydrolase [Nitrospiraceae bacterium]|jgi:glyoxylase-like metal-dependent hydrolase (beta-lactamase superfamily II)|nr:MBL fold metallo-hydrolase [Nitrospiraceae bacterium]